jgi:NAD-dependent dihydropyrimidine dehydrogenase PreA subunit
MPNIAIDESGCRACNLCVEICPTDVLEMDSGGDIAKVVRIDDCIGCTSCMYLCPSRCLEVTEFAEQRPFYRIEQNTAFIAKFLQKKPAIAELTEPDLQEALGDLSQRLVALATTTVETVGRGQKALGRRSGALAASHLPEMYESADPEGVTARLKNRFQNCFDFEPKINDGKKDITFKFSKCAVAPVVKRAGDKVGEASLCTMFHEYWVGLLEAFMGMRYVVEMVSTGDSCEMRMKAREM